MKIKYDIHQRILRSFDSLRLCYNLSCRSKLTNMNAASIINKCHLAQKPEFYSPNKIQPQYDLMIIVPVYNGEKFIEECISSVLSQKLDYSYCIFIINDGSTDTTAECIRKYEQNPNITVVHQKNRGLSGARNRALECISGDYVMFLDSDDYLFPGSLQKLLQVAYENDADVVEGSYQSFWENGKTEIIRCCDEARRIDPHEMHGFACMKIIRSQLLQNFCFPEGFLYEDTVISKLLVPECKRAFAIPDIVYGYRMHSATISATSNADFRHLDTFWITKYCLEESAERGNELNQREYIQYLQQSWVNWIRTKDMPIEVQEAMFVATAHLYDQFFGKMKLDKYEKKYRWLSIAMRRKSFSAYEFVMKRWELL